MQSSAFIQWTIFSTPMVCLANLTQYRKNEGGEARSDSGDLVCFTSVSDFFSECESTNKVDGTRDSVACLSIIVFHLSMKT